MLLVCMNVVFLSPMGGFSFPAYGSDMEALGYAELCPKAQTALTVPVVSIPSFCYYKFEARKKGRILLWRVRSCLSPNT